jgi:ATP-dependent 26S proteasome regulatory subunit
LDDAFIRRLTDTVHFPFPDEKSRVEIWHVIWPQEAPLAADVDFNFLANRYQLSGGNIKNVALTAAFLAAADQSDISLRHLLQAIQREYLKMGKVIDIPELEAVP